MTEVDLRAVEAHAVRDAAVRFCQEHPDDELAAPAATLAARLAEIPPEGLSLSLTDGEVEVLVLLPGLSVADRTLLRRLRRQLQEV